MGAALTPMLRQYKALKRDNPDAILLFRMGDFYEMFYEDAQRASGLLELTLTARGKGTDNVVPMCGFPYHQLEPYTARLVRAEQRVAICDQVEDPKQATGLVRREVVRVVTPGTVTDPDQLDATANAWIASVAESAGRLGAAFLDLSTGEFLAWDCHEPTETGWNRLTERVRAFAPREIVHAAGFAWNDRGGPSLRETAMLTPVDDYMFNRDHGHDQLKRQFNVDSLDGYGFRGRPAAIAAAGGLLQYAQDTQKCSLAHIHELLLHDPSDALMLDETTRRNLELERSIRTGDRRGSLLHAIDRTVTPAGARLLRRFLLAPLLNLDRIGARQDAIAEMVAAPVLREDVRECLKGVFDIERLLTKTVSGSANPRDLVALRHSLGRLPELVETLASSRAELIRDTLDGLDLCDDVRQRLATALADDPPVTLREGGAIRDGFNAELDELRSIRTDGRSFISALESTERERTKIASLKVRFNKVFGYYIEVSKTNLHLVPEHYHRKQTIANGERFITPELKEHEAKVLNAQERIESLELTLFAALREETAAQAQRLRAVARATALLDVLAGLADIAVSEDYQRPRVRDTNGLVIRGGRHPVVEQSLAGQHFVPNDTLLGGDHRSIGILTGPNMGGKSTYLRQVAVITLLAQTGSFVPAEEADIGIVDRIFCRVGASDSLSEGQSTFMVEMTETANILHHATRRSLVLLDEIGRGTSTFDGLSIAWAVVEHLHAVEAGVPRTLFATHYHELTELAVELDSVMNLHMAVRERGNDVVFLHRVDAGPSDRSYGIHVARLAGVPPGVVRRAAEILANLERGEYGRDGLPRRAHANKGAGAQPTLFGMFDPEEPKPRAQDPVIAEVLSEIRGADTDEVTPLQALNRLVAWKRQLRGTKDR
ncbi:MAG: DNA mismatch repair protein MutS [Acidobacteria bacterium]|nr:MAG: DNA mismatch repair protein MutS [Acidobacteriota bacterium]